MHAVGYNCLPRNGIDWAAIETHYERHQPALSVVFLEPSGIERLSAKSPNTLYVYRHHIPGLDNDDDAQDPGEEIRQSQDSCNEVHGKKAGILTNP